MIIFTFSTVNKDGISFLERDNPIAIPAVPATAVDAAAPVKAPFINYD